MITRSPRDRLDRVATAFSHAVAWLRGPQGETLRWAGVAAVGVLVGVLIVGLQLFGRLGAGQELLDGARGVFAVERVVGDRAGVAMVSRVVDVVEPLAGGGAAVEGRGLVGLVSQRAGVSRRVVVARMRERFPRTMALLASGSLAAVAVEWRRLRHYLGVTLHVSGARLDRLMRVRFPRLTRSLAGLPAVVGGWDRVPGTRGLTGLGGRPVRSVSEVAGYLGEDVVGVLERQRPNFERLDARGGVGYLPAVILALGGLVTALGLGMAWLSRYGIPRGRRGVRIWAVVPAAGALSIVVLVGGLQLFGRLGAGQELLDGARGVFAVERVVGDRAGVAMVSRVVDVVEPLAGGGAAVEGRGLVGLVSQRAGVSRRVVVARMRERFPRTMALLASGSLAAVAVEWRRLRHYLGVTLHVSGARLDRLMRVRFPRLTRSLAGLPAVVGGWDRVPGTRGLTGLGGRPVRSVSEVAGYLGEDVVGVLERQRPNFERLDARGGVGYLPAVILAAGALLVLYGLRWLGAVSRADLRRRYRTYPF